MLGRSKRHYHHYGCDCISKSTISNRETKQWLHDYIDEDSEAHEEWINSFSGIGGQSSIGKSHFNLRPLDRSKVIEMPKEKEEEKPK